MFVRVVLVVLGVLSAHAALAQPPKAAYVAPRTGWGAPELNGLWTNTTMTPLQRPAQYKGITVPPSEAAAFARAAQAQFNEEEDGVGGRQSEWWELAPELTRVDGAYRTSLLVDPPDGKLPYSPAGQALQQVGVRLPLAAMDGPETRPSPERCLTGGSGSGSVPMLPGRYNAHYTIVQTRDEVAIWMESTGVRIVRIGARAHLPAHIRPWSGDSIGRWEGDTLVVETTNLNPGEVHKTPQPISISADARVTEQFRRISPTEILYSFEVDAPAAFTRPWRGELVMRAAKGPPYEYACHEGNYGLPGILAGARAQERAAPAAPTVAANR
jgi:hypothetical protein